MVTAIIIATDCRRLNFFSLPCPKSAPTPYFICIMRLIWLLGWSRWAGKERRPGDHWGTSKRLFLAFMNVRLSLIRDIVNVLLRCCYNQLTTHVTPHQTKSHHTTAHHFTSHPHHTKTNYTKSYHIKSHDTNTTSNYNTPYHITPQKSHQFPPCHSTYYNNSYLKLHHTTSKHTTPKPHYIKPNYTKPHHRKLNNGIQVCCTSQLTKIFIDVRIMIGSML